MELEDILKQSPEDQVKIFSVKQPLPEYEILKKQWNPQEHDVLYPVFIHQCQSVPALRNPVLELAFTR